ncbi:hypothetical protein [Kordiimonas aestuarii]|uniref:hypothetical protein n=1 Tax=Kordiimonas aestuarii TaxID=1005925 RepID=UPI0021D0DC9C|nr:hypothetical protein [Kordiimonas aestuarii]
MTDIQKAAPAADDAIRRVLSANVEDFEKKDAMGMAVVGFVVASLNLAFALLMIWRSEDSGGAMWLAPMFNTVAILGLSFLVTQHVRPAGIVLISVVSAAFVANIVANFLGEAVSYPGLGLTLLVAIFVLGKMYPGLGALKTLDKGERAGATKVLQPVFLVWGALAVLNLLVSPVLAVR